MSRGIEGKVQGYGGRFRIDESVLLIHRILDLERR